MNDGLATAELLDCQGRRTHRLVLEPDGTITVHFLLHGHCARVDPARRRTLTPGIHVPEELMAQAAALQPW